MSAPTSLTGYMDSGTFDIDAYGATVDYLLEQIPALTHPWSVWTYSKMRHEPQLSASLQAYMLAIERGTYSIDPAGCRDEVVEQIADDLGLPIMGYSDGSDDDPEDPDAKIMTPTGARRRGFTWAEHLRLAASLSLTFGHAPFAQQWNDEKSHWRLGLVQERLPWTITERKLNPDGTLKSVVQGIGLENAPEITTSNHELIWYARQREGTNYYGQSLLRPSYGPWVLKDEMTRVLGVSNRRNGMGVWQVQAPPSALPNQIIEAQRIASTTKASNVAGIGLPPGFTAELKGMTGTLPDTLGFITYLDRLETRSMFTSILDMATSERGARSLGETVMALMVFAQQAEGQRIVEDATKQLVIPLVDANWGENEPAPQVHVTGIGRDKQLTAQDMAVLLQYGGLNPDDRLEEDTRAAYGLPPIDKATRRFEITEQPAEPPADPAAPEPPEGAPNA